MESFGCVRATVAIRQKHMLPNYEKATRNLADVGNLATITTNGRGVNVLLGTYGIAYYNMPSNAIWRYPSPFKKHGSYSLIKKRNVP